MLNKKIQIAFTIAMMALSLNAQAPNNTNNSKAAQVAKDNATFQEKVDIMKRDEIDNTDAYVIQLGDSEIEDEEEIDHLEHNNTFPLPHSPQK